MSAFSTCETLGSGPSEDELAQTLSREALVFYRAANEEYRGKSDRYFEKICLNSAKRSVLEQIDLYERRKRHTDFGGPYFPAADNPGYSIHEYGFAIDVGRLDRNGQARDQESLKPALENNGWTQHSGTGEGHHFNCVSAPSYSLVEIERRRILEKYIDIKYDIITRIAKEIEVEELAGAVKKSADYYRQSVRDLNRLRARLDREKNRLEAVEEDLEFLEFDLDDARAKVRAAQRDISSVRRRRCPDGNIFEVCEVHTDWKQAYSRDLRAAQGNLNRAEEEQTTLKRRERRLRREQRRISRLLNGLEEEMVEADQELSESRSDLDNARRHHSQAQTQFSTINEKISSIAENIQAEIDAFIANIGS